LMNSPAPFVVNRISRYIRRFSSVEGTLTLFNRFSIVPELSSAARIPLPGATSFFATDSKFSAFIFLSYRLQKMITSSLQNRCRKANENRRHQCDDRALLQPGLG